MRINFKKTGVQLVAFLLLLGAASPAYAAYTISQGGTNTTSFSNGTLTYFDGTKLNSASLGGGLTFAAGVLTALAGGFAYPFPGNATSTQLTFNGGIVNNATSTGSQGFNITGGCFAINGVCVSGSGGGVSSVSATYPIISSGGATPVISTAFGTTTNNVFSGTNTFNNGVTANTLSIGALSGFLKATAGAVSTALVDLTADVSGILPIANGGTGAASFTAGNRLVVAHGTSPFTDIALPLTVSNGGTGSTTLTGILKGAGTGIIATAIPGTDYQAPITLTTTGTSGAATFISNILNIPNYATGGTSLLTNVGANTFLNTGTNLQAPVLMATSTTATSTFAGDVAIGGNNGNPNPYLFIGTSTSRVPLYGRVQGDILDAEYDWNGQSSLNVANANIGSCASATFFADGNNPSLGGYFGTFSFLNDGWTGVGCSIGVGTAAKPEAVAISNPTGEMDFIIASSTNSGFADFNWFSNTNTPLMKLTNAGRLGIGTTTPASILTVNTQSNTANAFSVTNAIGSSTVRAGTLDSVTDTFGVASSTGQNEFGVDAAGHNWTGGVAPVPSTCGTSPSIVGDDNSGTITIGTGVPTACTLTFNKTWAQTPTCSATSEGTGISAFITAISGSAITFGLANADGGGKLYYQCVYHHT